ncbi:MAG TPA: InlB B-repeat-containing protein, partial [Acidimicrobiales bacterium]
MLSHGTNIKAIHRVVLVGSIVASLAIFGAEYPTSAYAQGAYHTVTFAENDSPSDMTVETQTANAASDLTSFSSLAFSNPGSTFVNWNTQPDDSGTTYSDGQIYNFSAALTLYAIWKGPDVTVTFAENDSSTDSTVATQTENSPTRLTLFADLSPEFNNAGSAFTSWNTEANGEGTSYSDGTVFGFSTPTVLYAQWTANQNVTATFGDNGGTGNVTTESDNSGTTITLPTSANVTRVDFVLGGWNTEADGGGTEYLPGATVSLNSNETFYAQWTETSPLSVVFEDNGGTGTDPSVNGELGAAVQLPGASTLLTYPGYSLTSWNSQPDGTGTSYGLGQTLTLSEPLTLYAQWMADGTFIVALSANGGSGSLTSLSGDSGSSVKLPGATSVVRSGYTLSSWNTAANGSGTSYAPGQTINLSSNVTLYAQWKRLATSTLYGVVGTFGAHSAALTPALAKKIR